MPSSGRIVAAIAVLLTGYLIGAFGVWNFNPGEWATATRWAVGLCALIIAAMVAFIPET